MQAELDRRGEIVVLEVRESIIDINNISEFRDLLEETSQEAAGGMVLDLSGTSYIGSVGLGMVSLTSIMMQKEGRGFGVVVQTDAIKRLFDISGLRKVMLVEESLEAVLAKLR